MSTDAITRLDRIAERYAAKPAVSEMSIAADQPRSDVTWRWGATDRPYFIASITKLFTVAVIMQLRSEGTITLDTRVADLLDEQTLQGLVVHDGIDYAARITVRQLL
ncbi:MAG TPA: serine hydrolase, partial [Jiangellaceae bacterium]|nr:serine hydrolase [Jiangellaceae bacterium]